MRDIIFSKLISEIKEAIISEISECELAIENHHQRLNKLKEKLYFLEEIREKGDYMEYIDENFHTAFYENEENGENE